MSQHLAQFRNRLQTDVTLAEASLTKAVAVAAYALLQAEVAIVAALKSRKTAIEVAG